MRLIIIEIWLTLWSIWGEICLEYLYWLLKCSASLTFCLFLGSQQLQKSRLYQSVIGWCKRGYLCQLPSLLSEAKDQNLSVFLELSRFMMTVLYYFFSHYSVPTLNTSWLHLFSLIGKIPSNLENILNRIVSETLILISIYVKGNSLSHVMEQSRGDPASDKSYFQRFKCHILD